jgi:DNA polymerase-3 subunit delta
MADQPPPVVYLLHGEDDFAIQEFIERLEANLGDATMIEVNTTLLDGRSMGMADLENAVRLMPFLVPRRLVLVTHPSSKLRGGAQRDKFKELLERVPATTALVLVEPHILTSDRDRKNGKLHWLETWCQEAGERAFVRPFTLPSGPGMVRWIQGRAATAGGEFSYQGAVVLHQLLGDEPGLLDSEIHKLLAYVGYARPVELDDVEYLTPAVGKLKDFALVDALRQRDTRQALKVLHQMTAEGDTILIFHSVVHQFRMLLLARDVLDRGGNEAEVARQLKLHPYAARLNCEHARQYSLPVLESIYHHLLTLDEAMKTGQMEGELALDLLVTRLTMD